MCDQIKQLIKAHAIPRKFFEGIRGTGNYSVLIDANKPLKAAGTYYQAGAYDNEILCEDCEKKFSDFDSYGWQILGKPSLANPLYHDFEEFPYAYKIDCNTDKIRRFNLFSSSRAVAQLFPKLRYVVAALSLATSSFLPVSQAQTVANPFSGGVSNASPSDSLGIRPKHHWTIDYVKLLWCDTGAVLTAPAHWNEEDWMYAGFAAAGIGGAAALDNTIK
jgi:hypothetical protein